jgi:hypothetical protein
MFAAVSWFTILCCMWFHSSRQHSKVLDTKPHATVSQSRTLLLLHLLLSCRSNAYLSLSCRPLV